MNIGDFMREEKLREVEILIAMWKKGLLGGEIMPEDANPLFKEDSLENYLYFTLPMALNYQRNSYTLWEGAKKTALDKDTSFVFNPYAVIDASFDNVQEVVKGLGLAYNNDNIIVVGE